MKHLYYFLFLLCTFSLYAQKYEANIVLTSGKNIQTKSEIPKTAGDKKIETSNGTYESDNILSIDISINGTNYTFYRLPRKMYSKNKSFERKKKFWHIEASEDSGILHHLMVANAYRVNRKGDLKIISSGNPPMMEHSLWKEGDSHSSVVSYSTSGALIVGNGKIMENAINHYLKDCPELVENVKKIKKEYSVSELVLHYNTQCQKK